MNYGDLLKGAWHVTWRHKYLWVLGFFAAEGGGCGLSGDYSFGADEPITWSGRTWVPLGELVERHWPVVLALVAGGLALALVFLVLRVVAAAGLIHGTDQALAGRPGAGLGAAWRRGLQVFWPMVGLGLLTTLIALAGILAVAGSAAVPIAFLVLSRDMGPGGVIGVALIALGAVAVLIPAAVALQLVWNWSTRALVLQGRPAGVSLRLGWRILRDNPGHSLLAWALQTAISIAASIPAAVALAVLGLPVVLLLLHTKGDLAPFAWSTVGLAAFVVLAALGVYGAAVSTYVNAYWTAAFRQITAGIAPAATAPPGGPSGDAPHPSSRAGA
ncbi:MAG: hypothetical protein Kow00122_15340 [Thermoleophilia bacterium]